MDREAAFEIASASVRFGPGVTREVGMDLADLGVGRVLVVADPIVSGLAAVHTVQESLDQSSRTATPELVEV